MSFSEWKETTIGNEIELIYGKSLPKTKRIEGNYPVYGSGGVTGTHNEALVKGPGIVVGRKGTVGSLYYEKRDYFPIDTVYYIKESPKYDLRFIYYFLKTRSLDKMNSHSAVPGLNREEVYKKMITIPAKEEQKAIANILSSLDEKIELNNQMNKTLEEMAQALFKRWFVDFEFPNEDGEPYKSSGGEMVDSELGMIPRGWEVHELEELLYCIKKPVKAGEHLEGVPYLPIDTLPMKTLSIKEYKSWEEAKSSLISFQKDDIILGAMRVYFHRVCLAPFDGITRTTCFVLRPKQEELHGYLTMQLFQEETINFANSTSKGTTMPYAVWENGLNKMKVVAPCKNVNIRFSKAIDGILESIRDSLFESIYLKEIRDALLPKLMSGEIRVTDLQN